MRVVERPDIRGQNVPCVECDKSTRSHRLENPEYEEYEEVWEEEAEEYQGKKKKADEELTEEEVVIRYRLLTQQVCMCHGCWVPKREKALGFLGRNKDLWVKDASSYISRIKRFLKSWNYYGFDDELAVSYQEDIRSVRAALKNSAGISEEE